MRNNESTKRNQQKKAKQTETQKCLFKARALPEDCLLGSFRA